MKPTKLTIEGLNSFKDEQVIDFEILSSEGIFGIFGPTGSGKSTVLDAITFALYGRIAREGSSKASAEVINLNKDSARVIFEFQVNGADPKTYRILREIKKNKLGGANTSQVKIFDISQEEIILAENVTEFNDEIAKIIGLRYEDFVKTVVLPQGGFNEFLKMEGNDRRKVLERLFNLEQYGEDLANKVRARQKNRESILLGVAGQLKAYEDLSEDKLKQQKIEIEAKENEEKDLKGKKQRHNEELEKANKQYELQIRLKAAEGDLQKEKEKSELCEAIKKEIENSRKFAVVEAQINDFKNQVERGKEQRRDLTDEQKSLKQLEDEKSTKEKLYAELKTAKEEKIPLLIEQKTKLNNALESYASYNKSVKASQSLAEEISIIKKALEGNIKSAENTEQEITRVEAEIQSVKNKIESLQEEESNELDLQRAIQIIGSIGKLKKSRTRLEAEATNLIAISEEMQGKNSKEEAGNRIESCRLKLAETKTSLSRLEIELDNISAGEEAGPKAILDKLEARKKQKEDLKRLQLDLEEAVKKHQKTLQESKEKQKNSEINLAAKNAQATQLCASQDEIKEKLIMLLGKWENPENQLSSIEKTMAKIQKDYEDLKAFMGSIDEKIRLSKEKVDRLQTKMNIALENALELQNTLYSKVEELGIFPFSQMTDNKSAKLMEVIKLMAGWRLSREEANLKEKQVTDHQKAIDEINGKIQGLKDQVGKDILAEEDYFRIKKANEALNKDHEDLVKLLSGLKLKHDADALNFETAKGLLEEQKALAKELGILDELYKLIGARKFVEFMAINQLKYVTLKATEMLDKITGGSYGLEVDNFGMFKVRDNKNGGEMRSVKNLSGGETFLVSLSLALALSAQIQLKGVAPLELFFLDEGFGTLDDDLLDTVMEALEKVHHDRLRIGLISHVEQLKNRIPVKLTVSPAVSGLGGSKVRIEYS